MYHVDCAVVDRTGNVSFTVLGLHGFSDESWEVDAASFEYPLPKGPAMATEADCWGTLVVRAEM